MAVRTTVVGSWPIPFGLRPHLKRYYSGELSEQQAASYLTAAARIAMDEQIACGLDEIMGGEVFAPDFLHHVPPRLHGLETLRARDTSQGWDGIGVYEVVGELSAPSGTGHAAAYLREVAIEPSLGKVSIPSPLTIGHDFRSQDRSYLHDLTRIVKNEIKDMLDAGAREIQLDAPMEAVELVSGTQTVDDILPFVKAPLEVAAGVTRSVHFCLGDISRTTATESQNLRSLLPLIQQLEGYVDRVHIECSYPGQWEDRQILRDLPDSMEIIAGIADVKSPPSSDELLIEKIEDLKSIIPTERLLVSSSCGCGRVPHDQAIRLMRNLVKAAASC
jgi:methionine synthase II (cobalamin-independent)